MGAFLQQLENRRMKIRFKIKESNQVTKIDYPEENKIVTINPYSTRRLIV